LIGAACGGLNQLGMNSSCKLQAASYKLKQREGQLQASSFTRFCLKLEAWNLKLRLDNMTSFHITPESAWVRMPSFSAPIPEDRHVQP
jgi:hypothetical protein